MVYHRLYDVTNITVISNKNTVGVYDMESQVKAERGTQMNDISYEILDLFKKYGADKEGILKF